MVDVLNAVGVTHVCFGNHENDVPLLAQLKRCDQFKGVWLNTNMPDYQAGSEKMPRWSTTDVKSMDGTHVRNVAFLGQYPRITHRHS